MCGRFALRLPRGEIRQNVRNQRNNLDVDDEWIDEDEFIPRYNIAPRTYAPVIRRRNTDLSDCASGTSSKIHQYVLQSMKWGLVPHWSKVEDKTLNTNNARSENLVEGGGMWDSIKGKKRCVIICQGYYEWLTKGKLKLPHFTKHQDGKLMLMAGLYDCVTLEGQNKPLWTFSIVTTAANKDFMWLHDRQPVILSTQEMIEKWLDTSSRSWTSELSKLVEPYHDRSSPLECYQVPKEVGKVGTESQTFIQPISQRKDGIQAMFMRQKTKPASASPKPQTQTQERILKRSRSKTPTDLTADDHEAQSQKKSKEDSETIGRKESKIDQPSTPKKMKINPTESPKRGRFAKEDTTNARITSFFHKT